MGDFKQFPMDETLQALRPDGTPTDLRTDQQQSRLIVQVPDLFELMRDMMVVLKKIEIHLASLTDEVLQDGDVGGV